MQRPHIFPPTFRHAVVILKCKCVSELGICLGARSVDSVHSGEWSIDPYSISAALPCSAKVGRWINKEQNWHSVCFESWGLSKWFLACLLCKSNPPKPGSLMTQKKKWGVGGTAFLVCMTYRKSRIRTITPLGDGQWRRLSWRAEDTSTFVSTNLLEVDRETFPQDKSISINLSEPVHA